MKKPKLVSLAVSFLRPRPDWVSRGEALLDQLAESLKKEGQLQPLVVVERGEGRNKHGLIMIGGHRWKAAQKAGLEELLCLVIDGVENTNDRRAKEIAENLIRAHIDAEERNAMRLKLLELRTVEEGGSGKKPNDSPERSRERNSTPVLGEPSKTGAAPRLAGRKPSPRGEKIAAVAAETGTTAKALSDAARRAEKKAEAAAAPRPDGALDELGREIPERSRAAWLLLREALGQGDRLMRDLQALLTKLEKDAGSKDEPLGSWVHGYSQRWRQMAHALGHEIRTYTPRAVCPWCKPGTDCGTCRKLGLIDERMLERAKKEISA